jgi:hypothetical protein
MRKRIVKSTIVIAAIALVLAWWLGWFSEDPALAEVKAMQAQLENPNMSEADVRTAMGQLREKMNSLSESSRRAAWENGRQVFERREMTKIGRILAMKPQQRVKAIDEEINGMERRRAQWEQRANQAQAGSNRPGGGQRGGGPGRRGAFQSDEQRVSRLKNRLDRSTPEHRAMRAEFTKLVNERRAQRGLPPMQRGRG